MTTDERVKQLAEEVRAQFVRDTRDDGTEFWHRKDMPFDRDWIQDLIYEAHGDYLPDDFRYEQIVNALDAIADPYGPEDLDDITEDLEAPYANIAKVRWLESHLARSGYADEAIEDGADGIWDILGRGMEKEMYEVYDSVLQSLRARAEELEEEEEEDEEESEDE